MMDVLDGRHRKLRSVSGRLLLPAAELLEGQNE